MDELLKHSINRICVKTKAHRYSGPAMTLMALIFLAPAVSLAQSTKLLSKETALTALVDVNIHRDVTSSIKGTNARSQLPVDPFMVLPRCDVLVTIDVKRVFDEALSGVLADKPPLRAMIMALADFDVFPGFDPQAVHRLVIGLSYANQGDQASHFDHSVVIAQSSQARQLRALMRQTGPAKYQERQYGGAVLYVVQPDKIKHEDQPANGVGAEWAIAALDSNTIVFGYLADVRSSIDLCAGRGIPVNADSIAALKRSPKALVVAVGQVSADAKLALTELGDSKLSQALSTLKQFGASFELTSTGLELSIALTAASADQARTLAEVLTAFRTLVGSITDDKTVRGKLLGNLFKELLISTAGLDVQIKSEINKANIDLMASEIGSRMYVDRGLAQMEKGDPKSAIAEYDKAIMLSPEDGLIFINRGKARADNEDLDGAIADYDQAIVLNPDSSLAFNNRGFAKIKRGNLDAAIADLEKAIALSPTFAFPYNNRGLALAQKGELDKALADYDKSIALDETNAFAYNNRGQARNQKQDWNGAVMDFDKSITLNPNSAAAYHGRGLAQYYRDELDPAIADYVKSITLDPGDAIVYSNLGVARTEKGDLKRAIADFDKAISINPKLAEAYNGRGMARVSNDELALATADIDQAIALNPGLAEAYGNRALLRLMLGRDAEAALDLKKCFELDESLKIPFEALAKELKEIRRANQPHH